MPSVTFADFDKTAEFPEGKRLLDCAGEMQIKLSQVCGGDGACGTCRIEVLSGWDNLTAPGPEELYKEMEEPFRLSCQARLLNDVVVKVAKVE